MRNLVFSCLSSRTSKRSRSPSPQSSRETYSSTINRVDFMGILPIELIYPILAHLSVRDLFQCFMVCQTWSRFISEWPVFWDRLAMIMPESDRSLANAVAHGSRQTIRLVGPMVRPLSIDLLQMLWHAKHCGSLVLDCLDLSSSNVNTGIYMSRVLSRHSSLVDLRINDCVIDASLAVGIFARAIHLEYLTIEKTSVEDDVSLSSLSIAPSTFMVSSSSSQQQQQQQQPSKQEESQERIQLEQQSEQEILVPPIMPTSCSGLIRIKISLVDHKEDNKALYRLLEQALKYCSNLVSLYLDANDPGNHTRCLYNATKASQHLRVCVVSPGCIVPEQRESTVINWQTYIEETERNPKIHSGLKVLVFTGNWFGRRGDLKTIVARHHRTLEFAYLFYDNDAIRPNVFSELGTGSCGALRLRELRLSTEKNADRFSGAPSWLSIERGLATLLTKCPSLEALKLICDFTTIADDLEHYLRVDARVLRAMAKGAPRLRHLEIRGQTYMPIAGLREFCAKGGGKRIEHLKLGFCDGITAEDILDMINQLPALKTFEFATFSGIYPDCQEAADILKQRGGLLQYPNPRRISQEQ